MEPRSRWDRGHGSGRQYTLPGGTLHQRERPAAQPCRRNGCDERAGPSLESQCNGTCQRNRRPGVDGLPGRRFHVHGRASAHRPGRSRRHHRVRFSWNPSPDGGVLALAASSGVLYAGGAFHHIGGQAREHIAEFDLSTGSVTGWNPNADGWVRVIQPGGPVVYAGGDFANVGGLPRNHLVALDAATAAPTPWDPNVDGPVRALAVDDDAVYAGGSFATVGGLPRRGGARIERGSGLPTAWDPSPNGDVHTLAMDGTAVLVGGGFWTARGVLRNRLGAIDLATGQPTDWNPGADKPVWVLARDGGVLYAGGDFAQVAGAPRAHLAAFDLATGDLTAWNPGADGYVRSLAPAGPTVYAGGGFLHAGGQPRACVAALDATTGAGNRMEPGFEWSRRCARRGARCGLCRRVVQQHRRAGAPGSRAAGPRDRGGHGVECRLQRWPQCPAPRRSDALHGRAVLRDRRGPLADAPRRARPVDRAGDRVESRAFAGGLVHGSPRRRDLRGRLLQPAPGQVRTPCHVDEAPRVHDRGVSVRLSDGIRCLDRRSDRVRSHDRRLGLRDRRRRRVDLCRWGVQQGEPPSANGSGCVPLRPGGRPPECAPRIGDPAVGSAESIFKLNGCPLRLAGARTGDDPHP